MEKCEIVLYADDILIFTNAKTDNLCHENFSKHMEKINIWFMMYKLNLNENKTKLLEINLNNNTIFNTSINNVIIEKLIG